MHNFFSSFCRTKRKDTPFFPYACIDMDSLEWKAKWMSHFQTNDQRKFRNRPKYLMEHSPPFSSATLYLYWSVILHRAMSIHQSNRTMSSNPYISKPHLAPRSCTQHTKTSSTSSSTFPSTFCIQNFWHCFYPCLTFETTFVDFI